jgi:hypothetical protein
LCIIIGAQLSIFGQIIVKNVPHCEHFGSGLDWVAWAGLGFRAIVLRMLSALWVHKETLRGFSIPSGPQIREKGDACHIISILNMFLHKRS